MRYELYHHGILGQRWGVRRFQNKDGSLTEAGRKREERKIARYQDKFGFLTPRGEKKAYLSDGTLNPKFVRKYYRDKNGRPNHNAKVRSEWLNEDARNAAMEAIDKDNTKHGGKARGDALSYTERVLKEKATVMQEPLSKTRSDLVASEQRYERMAETIAKNVMKNDRVTRADDSEITSMREHAAAYRTMARTLDKYMDDIKLDHKTEKRVNKILEDYDMFMINRVEQTIDGYRKYAYDD